MTWWAQVSNAQTGRYAGDARPEVVKAYGLGDSENMGDQTGEDITAARLNENRDAVAFLGTPPACRATSAALVPHNAGSGTEQILLFDTDRYDTDTMHSTASNTGRMVAKTAGKFLFHAQVEWNGSALGTYRYQTLRLNAVTIIGYTSFETTAAANAGLAIQCEVSTTYAMAVNDYVEVIINQNTGGNLNVNKSGNYSPEFMATWQSL